MIGVPLKCYVVHDYYGCESGCDGHNVLIEDARGETHSVYFDFGAPYSDDPAAQQKWARDLAAEHAPGVPFSWEDCRVHDS